MPHKYFGMASYFVLLWNLTLCTTIYNFLGPWMILVGWVFSGKLVSSRSLKLRGPGMFKYTQEHVINLRW